MGMLWEAVRVLPNNTDGRESRISASFLGRKGKEEETGKGEG